MVRGKIIQKEKYKRFPPVKLYLDAIEKLVEVFELNNILYTIDVNEEYKYEKLSDLKEDEKYTKIKSFRIQSIRPYVSVYFKKNGAHLYTELDDIESTGLFNKLNDIIAKRQKRPSFLYSLYTIWAINILYVAVSLLNFYSTGSKTERIILHFLFLVIFATLVGYIFYQRMKRFSTIYLFKKESQPSFFTRNKDQIVLVLVGAVVGALLTALAEYYLNKN